MFVKRGFTGLLHLISVPLPPPPPVEEPWNSLGASYKNWRVRMLSAIAYLNGNIPCPEFHPQMKCKNVTFNNLTIRSEWFRFVVLQKEKSASFFFTIEEA